MHKSVFTFGVLITSLVMLAVMPFLTNYVAMAQGYDNYEDSYSQYPTDDKKYECKTGPFEGFFVSSVEFCKHVKFDDRKDHRDDKTGPKGPPGPQGPSGSPDVGQIPPENIYTALGPINSTDTSGFATSSALCMQGDIAVGGGFVITSPDGLSDVNQITSIPPGDLFESNEQEWLASVISSGETDVSINAVARCLNNQPS
ncbi:MAG: hypothetical protein ACRD8K_03515 [Nitrososphaeraceae archaeon]